MSNDDTELQYCNWTFWEVIKPNNRWGVNRDCDDKPLTELKGYGLLHDAVTHVFSRGGRDDMAYRASLQPQLQTRYPQPRPGAQCPNCGKQVNGVDPYDDGQTWRR